MFNNYEEIQTTYISVWDLVNIKIIIIIRTPRLILKFRQRHRRTETHPVHGHENTLENL